MKRKDKNNSRGQVNKYLPKGSSLKEQREGSEKFSELAVPEI